MALTFYKTIDTGRYRTDFSQGVGAYQCAVEPSGTNAVELQYSSLYAPNSWYGYPRWYTHYSLSYSIYIPNRGDLFGDQGVYVGQYGQPDLYSNKVYIALQFQLINWDDIKYALQNNLYGTGMGTSDLNYRLYIQNLSWKFYRV